MRRWLICLAGVDPRHCRMCRIPQRLAIDRILLRASARAAGRSACGVGGLPVGPGRPWRAVAGAGGDRRSAVARSVQRAGAGVRGQATQRPSGRAGNRARRRRRRVTTWLQLPTPDAIARITLRPLSIGARAYADLRAARAGVSAADDPADPRGLRRQSVLRHRAGARDRRPGRPRISCCRDRWPSWSERGWASRRRCSRGAAGRGLPGRPHRFRWYRAAIGTDEERLLELLAEAEEKAIVGIDGNRLRFTHPLLASGVYTDAAPAQRRMMHRRLGRAR